MINEVNTGTSLSFQIISNFWEYFLKQVVINNSGGSGFPIFIFVKFPRVVKFLLLRPTLDFGSVLLYSEFSFFSAKINKGHNS